MLGDMTILRMDNVLIVVDDLDAVISFFLELGMELEGKGPIEGRWVERVIGIDDVRQDIAMLRTHGAELVGELAQYEDSYRLCYVRGPEGIIVGLAEPLG
jgi:hypothetical protein